MGRTNEPDSSLKDAVHIKVKFFLVVITNAPQEKSEEMPGGCLEV